MDELPRLEIRLQPAGVNSVAARIVALAANVVTTCLSAIQATDLPPPNWGGGFMGYNFPLPEQTDDERREAFQNWILGKGFQDLTRGIREALEEAHVYLAWINRDLSEPTTIEIIESEMLAARLAAQKPNFMLLLESVNAALTEPLTFDAEFLTLQKVRNCLEHRGGRVTDKDVDPKTGVMTLSFPRMKAFYMRREEEIELAVGEVIDTHDLGNPFGKGEQVPIYMRRVTRSRDYALGEAVSISPSDFYEIAMACHFFASDLAGKLPTTPQQKIAVDEA